MAEVAFGKSFNVTALAAFYGVSAPTIPRCLQLVASCSVEWQAFQIKRFMEMFDSCHPEFGITFNLWDETKERLVLKVLQNKELKLNQQSSAWEVMVVRRLFVWKWKGRIYTFEPTLAPVPLISNASSHLLNAMFFHPLMRPIEELNKKLQSTASLHGEFDLADAHPANDRLHFHRLQEEQSRILRGGESRKLMGMGHCANHQVNLVIIHIMSPFTKLLISGH